MGLFDTKATGDSLRKWQDEKKAGLFNQDNLNNMLVKEQPTDTIKPVEIDESIVSDSTDSLALSNPTDLLENEINIQVDEGEFQNWYKAWSDEIKTSNAEQGILELMPYGPDEKIKPYPSEPDYEIVPYDYRSAYSDGVDPEYQEHDNRYHFSSKYKHDDHPNRFIPLKRAHQEDENIGDHPKYGAVQALRNMGALDDNIAYDTKNDLWVINPNMDVVTGWDRTTHQMTKEEFSDAHKLQRELQFEKIKVPFGPMIGMGEMNIPLPNKDHVSYEEYELLAKQQVANR